MDNRKLVLGASSFRTSWTSDLLASIVVFLVALPLCMGIAIASGMPLERAAGAGIVTGIIGGLLVGVLAGSPLQVSGPAAGLIVIIADLINQQGIGALGIVVVAAGAIQIIAGLLGAGQWFRAVSPAVIHGMLSGIGVLIFASQFHVMVDDHSVKGNGIANLLSIGDALKKSLLPLDGATSHHYAARVGLLTIAVMCLWKPLVPKKLAIIPAPLVAVLAAVAVDYWFDLPIISVDLPDRITSAILPLSWQDLPRMLEQPLWTAALTVALVASAETLLCATAVDQMHRGPRTKYDRELFAQGVGNLCCGWLGVLPLTGVIVRSGANVEAGGRTRLSAVLHGFWLLFFVTILPHTLELIPTSSLAAILVYTGYKLFNPKIVRTLWSYSRGEVLIYVVTVASIVSADLLKGVLIGVSLSLLKLLYTFSHLSVRLQTDEQTNRSALHLRGTATFLRLPKLAAALEKVPANTELHVHFDQLNYIDHACLDLLMNWEKQHETTGGSLVIDWDTLTAKFNPKLNGDPRKRRARPSDAREGDRARSRNHAQNIRKGGE